MADPLTQLQQRLNQPWLMGANSRQFSELVQQRLHALTSCAHGDRPLTVLLLESDPTDFLAGFFAACAAQCSVFLGNPHWTAADHQRVLAVAHPDLIWSNGTTEWLAPTTSFLPPSASFLPPSSSYVLIPTGGSSGQVRFAIHTWDTLLAAVTGFKTYFPQHPINSCCVLPLYHVSGLMQALRSFVSGGTLAVLPFKSLETGTQLPVDLANFDPADFFLSLVPTQLQRLLRSPQQMAWLAQFHTVFLGGAPAWAELLTQARQQQIRLAPTYGMTETAAQIATLKPDDFLQGQSGCGQVLPHAQISICDQDGNCLGANQIGRVVIRSDSLAWGYVGDRLFPRDRFEPDDLGYVDDRGGLHIVGRSSDKIITGGENVFASEVEAAIRATGLVQDVCVFGVGDRHWGEVVTAFYVPSQPAVEAAQLSQALQPLLSKFKQPKRWVAVPQIPRSPHGKINRQQLQAGLPNGQPDHVNL